MNSGTKFRLIFTFILFLVYHASLSQFLKDFPWSCACPPLSCSSPFCRKAFSESIFNTHRLFLPFICFSTHPNLSSTSVLIRTFQRQSHHLFLSHMYLDYLSLHMFRKGMLILRISSYICGAGKSEICRVGQWARNTDRISVLQTSGRISSPGKLVFTRKAFYWLDESSSTILSE